MECCHCGCRGCASGDGGKKVVAIDRGVMNRLRRESMKRKMMKFVRELLILVV